MRSAPRRATAGPRPGSLAVAMALAGLAAIGWGCTPADPKEELRERAAKYLELKQKREWTAIYEGMVDPEARKSVKLEDFLKPRKESMDMLGYELISAEVDQDQGSVKAKVDVVIPILSPRGGATMMRKELEDSQRWVQRDGRWYIQPRS